MITTPLLIYEESREVEILALEKDVTFLLRAMPKYSQEGKKTNCQIGTKTGALCRIVTEINLIVIYHIDRS